MRTGEDDTTWLTSMPDYPTLLAVSLMPEPPPGQSPADLNPVGPAVQARIASFEETPDKPIRLTQKP